MPAAFLSLVVMDNELTHGLWQEAFDNKLASLYSLP